MAGLRVALGPSSQTIHSSESIQVITPARSTDSQIHSHLHLQRLFLPKKGFHFMFSSLS